MSEGSPTANQPWYHEGLRFTCTQCGDCCTGAPGYVWVSEEEIAKLAERLNLDVPTFERRYVRQVGRRKSLIEYDGGDCCFLVDRKCTVYEDRPIQCKTWPFWESNLRSRAAWNRTCEVCPGAGQGELVPLEQIEFQKNQRRV